MKLNSKKCINIVIIILSEIFLKQNTIVLKLNINIFSGVVKCISERLLNSIYCIFCICLLIIECIMNLYYKWNVFFLNFKMKEYLHIF